jgi:hypothetical protein
MGNSCINTRDPQFVELVKALNTSEAIVIALVNINGGIIPSEEDAKQILKNQKEIPADTMLVNSQSTEFKLKKAVEERGMLETLSLGTNSTEAQKATIQKLIDQNVKYQTVLNKNIQLEKEGKQGTRLTSVSNFIGIADMKGNVEKYADFKHYGLFVHSVLEHLLKSTYEDYDITKLLTKELFDGLLKQYRAKKDSRGISQAFQIKEMTDEDMFDITRQLVNEVQHFVTRGSIILPELTITAFSKHDSLVVGRMDMAVMSPTGEISIVDFKTKKVKGLITRTADTKGVNIGGVLTGLARVEHPVVASKEETADDFKQSKRSAFDTWFVQLEVYSNMLKQTGVDVSDNKHIISLLYETDMDNVYKGQIMFPFDNHDYYNQARAYLPGTLQNEWYIAPTAISKKLDKFKDQIDNALPIDRNAKSKPKEVVKPLADSYDIDPNEKKAEQLLKVMQNTIENQLNAVNDEIEKLNPKVQSELIEIKKAHKTTLNYLKNILENNKKSLVAKSIIFANTLDSLKIEISSLEPISAKAIKAYLENPTGENAKYQYDILYDLHKKNKDLIQIVEVLTDIANDAMANPENEITTSSPMIQSLNTLKSKMEIITARFIEASVKMTVGMIKGVGELRFNQTVEQLKDGLLSERASLQADIEALEAGKSLGVVDAIRTATSKALYYLTQEGRANLKSQLDIDGNALLSKIEQKQLRIQKIEDIINGLKYDDASLEKLVSSVTDPSSVVYLGVRGIYTPSSFLNDYPANQMMASANDSELGIAAVMIMLKNAEALTNEMFVNDLELQKVHTLYKELQKTQSLEKINDSVSEWREVSFYNTKTKSIDKKKELFYVKPYTAEYQTIYDEFQLQERVLKNEVKELEDAYFESLKSKNSIEIAITERKFLDAKNKLFELTTRKNNWMVENCNLPYVDLFYTAQSKLPQEYREELQRVYSEMDVINKRLQDPTIIDDSDFDMLSILEGKIKALKDKAKLENPEYAQAMEDFSNLYEYDVNMNYFNAVETNAKHRFSDNAEKLSKWYETYTISKPTSAWYELRSVLYGELNSYYEADEIINALREEKRILLLPYKSNGRINPKLMTDDAIAEFDRIEEAMGDRIVELSEQPHSKLKPSELKRIADVRQQLKDTSQRVLNPIYEKEFEDMTTTLESKLREVEIAGENYNTAKEENSSNLEALQKVYESLLTSYENFEQEYRQWFNSRHATTFSSPLSNNGNPRQIKNPKMFNYETVPSEHMKEEYMEVIPNPKYFRLKRLRLGNWQLNGKQLKNVEIEKLQETPELIKELEEAGKLVRAGGAYNPDYIDNIGNIPLPKGIVEKRTNVYEVQTMSKNVNPKFLALQSNPQQKEFYDALTSYFFNSQKKMEGVVVGYRVPGFASSFVEDIMRDGIPTAASRQIKILQDNL